MEATKVGTATDLPPIATLANWVVAAAKDKPYKYLFTYGALVDLLQVDPQGRRGRTAILKAQRILLDDYNKYLACVTSKGYEIASPNEHAGHVKRLRKTSIRKMVKARRVGIRVDISGLTTEELKSLTFEQIRTGAMLSFCTRVESKRKIETLQKELKMMSPKAIAKALTGKSG
jgi:hypothetical protein